LELTHSFTVPATLDETWQAFNDIEDVAGCFPGAAVTSVEGDDFHGTCKVKIGPIALTYTGAGTFIERDEAAHRFVLEAKGKDKRGNGTAGATVTATMSADSPESTSVEVKTDLSITGKPAQFGRGVIQDVSDKLLQQFIVCLESKVGAPPEAAAPAPAAEQPAAAAGLAGAPVGGAAPETPAEERVPSAAGAQAPGGGAYAAQPGQAGEALDLGATVLPILLKTYWRQIAGTLAVLLVLRWLLRRRRD
jgi:carbon monoxide dehydrogenase subunit G